MEKDRTPLNLSIEPFEKALASLEAALARNAEAPSDDMIRDAGIQRFEFTYELSHKMLKRYLEATSANPAEFDAITFQDLIRLGNERGLLLGDWSNWKAFRAARGATSHTYDQEKAEHVFAQIPAFVEEARFLLDKLREALA
ncbi:HI0074 family nucleotidyltransferase substrate-binding subunit [Sphingomonas bacterium]|uniref:HI0074 family nucleotidyltransferase substrate-binding subunit n=1 Tax=Sphingomonas bacterium TaxID=1895847 RepID=UPI001575CF0A|nr:HI0074 family nucleotidyltransferase substrate-binding subunit [Sphingomonas bacterium]